MSPSFVQRRQRQRYEEEEGLLQLQLIKDAEYSLKGHSDVLPPDLAERVQHDVELILVALNNLAKQKRFLEIKERGFSADYIGYRLIGRDMPRFTRVLLWMQWGSIILEIHEPSSDRHLTAEWDTIFRPPQPNIKDICATAREAVTFVNQLALALKGGGRFERDPKLKLP